jgi:imidazoleglycerol phosphate dehydratase HisB
MKLLIETSALKGSADDLLAPGALSGLKTLSGNGYLLSWDDSKLTGHQSKLLENEGIENSVPEQIDGRIKQKNSRFIFETDGLAIEEKSDWSSLVDAILFPTRTASLERKTKETEIAIRINLDGTGKSHVTTGLHFFDHMLDQIARHGLIDLDLTCKGDLEVDEHHTIEDTAIALGEVISRAVSKNKAGIQRYGFVLPMDEAQATIALDLSDRPFLRWDVDLKREYIGDFPTEMLEHFFYSIAMNAKATLHVKADGKNEHHIVESIFKGFAKALRFSISRTERTKGILPTTKGII